ncbi:MAG: hypothetical protein HZA53_08635 [Planctomycetes bacterium]|nr:hypothetical protein [Planctomycetota bacterium]
MKTIRLLAVVSIAFLPLACSHGGHAAAIPTEIVVQAATGKLPADPLDAQWARAAEFQAPLILQDMVEPRLLEPSTRDVRVRALTDGAKIAFRLEWEDATREDLPMPAAFIDACAVQLPSKRAADVPAPQMGEPGRPVEITLWRASWQAIVEGRPDTIQAIHPNALEYHYPFMATPLVDGSDAKRDMKLRYAPARALGNDLAGPRTVPVQDLVAEGPGTLAPAASTTSTGSGKRSQKGWSVVITRNVPAGLAPGKRTQAAFAVWQGAHEESGARKMRTGWTPVLMEGKP